MHGTVAFSAPATEPIHVSLCAPWGALNVIVGLGDNTLGFQSGLLKDFPLAGPAMNVGGSLFGGGTGDREITREPDICDTLNSGVEVLGGAISINVGEETRWLDGVVPWTRLGKVIRCRDWGWFYETMVEKVEDPLTIMRDIDGITGSENGEIDGTTGLDGASRVALDLELQTESVRGRVCHIIEQVVHSCTGERRVRTRGIGDVESVRGGWA